MESSAKAALEAFGEYDRDITIRKTRLGCFLGIVLVPLFALLDYRVNEGNPAVFLYVRLTCSLFIALLYPLLGTRFGQQHYRGIGLVLLMLPATSIAWMVCSSPDGAASPYYAGLNLVLLVLALVLDWTFWQSVAGVSLVLFLYLLVCIYAPAQRSSDVFNNFAFLLSTGIVIIIAAYFHSKLRLREFVSRFELDQSRQQLSKTNDKLVELGQVKDRFFANVSHELRTPLTLLLAPLETMIHRDGPMFNTETNELLRTMRDNGMRLLKLINDLLDLVRLESGRMEVRPEPLDLPEFIKGLSSAVRQVATEKCITLDTSAEPGLGTVLADRDKLEKVILNLLFNALKFTPRGGRVELHARRDDGELLLTVADTGVGISEKNLPFIFDRFWQADMSSKRKFQGVGIGLALVKELVELQSGRVQALSKEGQGTTFTVHLPYLAAETASANSQPQPDPSTTQSTQESKSSSEEWLATLYRRAELFPSIPRGGDVATGKTERAVGKGGPRILIADDEPDMLRFLRSQLSRDYQVTEAADGLQAVERAIETLPDIILLDMMMPGKDGREVCKELRGIAGTRNIPIILLTAKADETTKLAVLEAGASDFLSKPFSTTELHVRIRNLVQSYTYQRTLADKNDLLQKTIEQLKATEGQLVESEKLRSLGQLSAGMIHEINNPLNFAATGLYTLRNKAKYLANGQAAEYVEVLDDVDEGIRRVKDLVSKMREFSYADNSRVEEIELLPVINSALRFLSHEWQDRIQVHIQLPPGQCIFANKNRMTQVLLNLLQNSLDAIGRKSFAQEKPSITIQGEVDSDRSILIIRDNGAGIDAPDLGKVFDPFFTTKDVGQGMGLGLSISYRIVQDYGGRITVHSQPGEFCEFRLQFPARQPLTDATAPD
jgi:signal transduction histidine kinase